MIQLTGRAAITLESNIIGFADNYGVRAALPQENVEFRNNIFAANLFNHLCDAQYLWADGSNWSRRVEGDSSYTLDGNQLLVPQLPVDAAFSDLALSRLFVLPSRIESEEWRSIAPAIGSTAKPQAEEQPAAASTPAPAPSSSGGSTLDALLAKIGSTTDKLKELDTKKAPPAPKYCPLYDFKKALVLATDGADTAPGAHRKKLEISFGTAQVKPQITYKPITAAELDEMRASLDQQPIELDVTQLRDSSSNPSVFPTGTDKKDYSAYAVAAVDGQTRTRLAIVVRDDTEVSKRIRRAQSTDKLHVRGTAFTTSGASGLSIIVDALELVGS
jgi:hypothetical protein